MTVTVLRSAESLARQHTEAAVNTINDVMTDPFAENKDRLKAAELMLDRGHGRPTSTVISVPAARRQREIAAAMSDDELLEVIQGAPLPALEAPVEAIDEGDLSDPGVDPLCL
ncbi:MAG: hypothetical protein KGL39_09535 [Patescibacteria group bacterium]|nr:hypothetical protein [Patescibacteria group bacterium]